MRSAELFCGAGGVDRDRGYVRLDVVCISLALDAQGCSGEGERTEHAALLLDQSAEVAEDLRQFVDACLNLADLFLTLLDEGLLECELLRR